MTKKEQAAFAELQKQLRLERAWRFSEAVEPDVPKPTSDEKRCIGYLPMGSPLSAYGGVEKASSCSGSHAWGSDAWHEKRNRSGSSQNGVCLYSSEALAWRALRHEACVEARRKLAEIDAKIEALEKEA
jgi:hypothetical protein